MIARADTRTRSACHPASPTPSPPHPTHQEEEEDDEELAGIEGAPGGDDVNHWLAPPPPLTCPPSPATGSAAGIEPPSPDAAPNVETPV